MKRWVDYLESYIDNLMDVYAEDEEFLTREDAVWTLRNREQKYKDANMMNQLLIGGKYE
jgi:hypothetical protein